MGRATASAPALLSPASTHGLAPAGPSRLRQGRPLFRLRLPRAERPDAGIVQLLQAAYHQRLVRLT